MQLIKWLVKQSFTAEMYRLATTKGFNTYWLKTFQLFIFNSFVKMSKNIIPLWHYGVLCVGQWHTISSCNTTTCGKSQGVWILFKRHCIWDIQITMSSNCLCLRHPTLLKSRAKMLLLYGLCCTHTCTLVWLDSTDCFNLSIQNESNVYGRVHTSQQAWSTACSWGRGWISRWTALVSPPQALCRETTRVVMYNFLFFYCRL